MKTRRELEEEITRLRDALSGMDATETSTSNDIGVAGRIAITRLRDDDWPDLIRVIEELPEIAHRYGDMSALSHIRTTIRTRIYAMILSMPQTGDLVRCRHRIDMMLSEGEAELLWRTDRAGVRSRADLLEVVAVHCFAPSILAAFQHGQETPAGILPVGPRGGN